MGSLDSAAAHLPNKDLSDKFLEDSPLRREKQKTKKKKKRTHIDTVVCCMINSFNHHEDSTKQVLVL